LAQSQGAAAGCSKRPGAVPMTSRTGSAQGGREKTRTLSTGRGHESRSLRAPSPVRISKMRDPTAKIGVAPRQVQYSKRMSFRAIRYGPGGLVSTGLACSDGADKSRGTGDGVAALA